MALIWILYSACTYVLGYPKDSKVHCPNEEHVQGVVESLKFSMKERTCEDMHTAGFQMPLHYPRYKKADYEKMEEWKLDMLLKEYGLNCKGTLDEKKAYAMGAFLWPDQV